MSKRGSITLAPQDEAEVSQGSETADLPEPEPVSSNDFTSWSETEAEPSVSVARRTTGAGTLLKIAFAGLAAATIFLLLKNRRP